MIPRQDGRSSPCPVATRSSPSSQSVPSGAPRAEDPAASPPPSAAAPSGEVASDQPGAPVSAATARGWPPEALELAQRLQGSLTIDDRQWHRLKAQRPRRAAEQLAAALVQLLAADDPKASTPTPARREAIALVEHALGWLRSELSDPGCPSHGR